MGNEHEYVSRPVRIKFKDSSERIDGHMIFDTGPNQDPQLSKLLTMVKFRINDAQKTETLFSLMDVDTIDYL